MGRRAEILEAERSYDLVKREKPESGKFIKDLLRFLFSQVGLIFLGGFVAFLGAEAYIGMETDAEEKRYENKRQAGREVEAAAEYLSSAFWEYATNEDRYNFTYNQFLNKVDEDLRIYTEFIVNSTRDYNYDGAIDGWDYFWTLPKALLFTITIMTTIGYGHIYPVTLIGQLFTIVYALVALPIFFVMMANVGNGLANGITYMYSRLCCRWFRAQRVKAEIPNRAMRKKLKRRLVDEEVGEEVFMPTTTIPIPIIVSVVILVAYILVGALMFAQWEEWDVGSAAYFSFVTLTTIGFGDYVPVKSFNGIIGTDVAFMDYFKMGFTVLYCFIGLVVISLCISLIQEQVARSAAIALGVKQEIIEMDVVEIVPRRPNFLHEDEPKDADYSADTAPLVVPVDDDIVDSPEPNVPGEVEDIEDKEDDENEDEEDEDDEDEEGEDDEDDEEDDEEEGDEDEDEEDDDDDDDDDEDEDEDDEDEDEDEEEDDEDDDGKV